MAVNLEIVKELVEARSWDDTCITFRNRQLTHPGDLPMDWRIEFEERAAILEYDGGLTRDEADAQALVEIKRRIQSLERD